MFKVRTQRLRSIVAERRWIALIIKMSTKCNFSDQECHLVVVLV